MLLMTNTVVTLSHLPLYNELIDVFSRKEYRDIVVDSLNFCIANKCLVVYGWVIMTNHIHLIITTKTERENISDLIRDFKKYTSRKITKTMAKINESRREWMLNAMSREAQRIGRAKIYKLWRDDNHAVLIDRYRTKIDGPLNYIHDNPVINGLVKNAWDTCMK